MTLKYPTLLLQQTKTQRKYVGLIYTFKIKANFYSYAFRNILRICYSLCCSSFLQMLAPHPCPVTQDDPPILWGSL